MISIMQTEQDARYAARHLAPWERRQMVTRHISRLSPLAVERYVIEDMAREAPPLWHQLRSAVATGQLAGLIRATLEVVAVLAVGVLAWQRWRGCV